jgi:hypothetical protein
MAKSLSYQEALTKGLVYPGAEQEALKITGGGKGFADTEAYKKAFEATYQQQKSGLSEYQKQIDQIQKDRDIAQQARSSYNAQYARVRSGKANAGIMGQASSQYNQIMSKYGMSTRGKGINIAWYDDNRFTAAFNDIVNKVVEQRKSASETMEQAMAKYQSATKEAVTAEKRETGATEAARRRLTRATGGLLAKAGVGGMVGTGLPDLGTGMGGGLGIESQLGRKVTL